MRDILRYGLDGLAKTLKYAYEQVDGTVTHQIMAGELKYYYWQWREGDTWKNEHIAPVNPRQ
jgi:hypothetical protein